MANTGSAFPETRLDWLQRDRNVIEGLDHLGIEVVSVSLYALLLPGITNVTDRVRYHTFYPWVLDQFAQGKSRGRRAWREWIRSLDFSLALACVAHEQQVDRAETAVVGAFTARRLLRDVTNTKKVVDFRELVELNREDKVPSVAYFANTEGGFGQYYKGAADELGLLQTDEAHSNPDRLLTTYAGVHAARCADDAFSPLLDIAAARRATLGELADVGALASPTAIPEGSPEEDLLRQVILEGDSDLSKGQSPRSRQWRRASLLLALHYVAACGGEAASTTRGELAYELRWACHAHRLPDGRKWTVPANLDGVLNAWGAYQRNDTMNYALEVLHWALLRRMDERRAGPTRLASELAGVACTAIPAANDHANSPRLGGSVDTWLRACERPRSDSSGEPWGPTSTWRWFDTLTNAVKSGDDRLAAQWAVRLLGRLVTDTGPSGEAPFATLPGAEKISAAYDVHYGQLLVRAHERATESLTSFLSDLLLEWVLFRHLRVATRKLAAQGVSTFKFRPEEGELVLMAQPPVPTLTTPRLRQAFQFLEDLHYIRRGDGLADVTQAGTALLRSVP